MCVCVSRARPEDPEISGFWCAMYVCVASVEAAAVRQWFQEITSRVVRRLSGAVLGEEVGCWIIIPRLLPLAATRRRKEGGRAVQKW